MRQDQPVAGGQALFGQGQPAQQISLVGVGMRNHAGIASRMFGALAREGINIRMISTTVSQSRRPIL